MAEASVPVVILTRQRDDVEFFNKTLRDAGHPARCRGVGDLDEFRVALESETPHLLIFFDDHHPAHLREVAKLRQLHARMSPLIVVRNEVDEVGIGEVLQAGANDLVSRTHSGRILNVCERELRAFRLERALNDTLRSASQYKKQLKSVLSCSSDAIAQVQEGIVVEANQAWAEVFSNTDADDALGPLMDFFTERSQAMLKGALAASSKGRWDGEPLRLDAVTGGGKTVPIELELQQSVFDGEPATRLSIKQREETQIEQAPEAIVEQALKTDAATGFLPRQRFLELLTDKLDQRPGSGARALAFIRPDRFGQVEQDVGPVMSEELVSQLAGVFGRLMSDADIAGRFGGTVFAVIVERGSLRDIQAWAENAASRIGDHVFEVANRSLSLTCSIGLAEMGEGTDRVEDLIRSAERANRRCREQGGNSVGIEETADESTRIKRIDALWVRQIKSALVDGRFRLVHLNIANLAGQSEKMFDTVVRLIDEQGDEIGASEFMGTAERNNLLRPIDRWVIDATLDFCAKESTDIVMVKLSHESILDTTLLPWISARLNETRVKPGNLCFQIAEGDASQYQKQSIALSKAIKQLGCRFAVENFGIGRDPLRVLMNTPMDYVKFDGSLMQRIADDTATQEQLRAFVSNANRNKIKTIASRVENANTMAVLFQLGVSYMQGHYLHHPEVILEEAI